MRLGCDSKVVFCVEVGGGVECGDVEDEEWVEHFVREVVTK